MDSPAQDTSEPLARKNVIADTTLVRRRLAVRGRVQGVGFRPFVHAVAAIGRDGATPTTLAICGATVGIGGPILLWLTGGLPAMLQQRRDARGPVELVG